jgi:hypothetical protein
MIEQTVVWLGAAMVLGVGSAHADSVKTVHVNCGKGEKNANRSTIVVDGARRISIDALAVTGGGVRGGSQLRVDRDRRRLSA